MGPNQNQYTPPPPAPQGQQPGIGGVPSVTPPPKRNNKLLVFATEGVLGFLLLISLAFGGWAFSQYQNQKNNVDQLAAEQVEAALAVQKEELDAGYEKLNQRVVNTYTGPSDYGSVSFKYPRDWSVYVGDQRGSTLVDLYADTGVVNGADELYNLRMSVEDKAFADVLDSFDRELEDGSLKSRPITVSGQTGVRLDGQIDNNVNGVMVLLPLRDRTIRFFTETTQFRNVFEDALKSLTFTP